MRNGNKQRELRRDYARQLDIHNAHTVLDQFDVEPNAHIGPRVVSYTLECQDMIEHFRAGAHTEYEKSQLNKAIADEAEAKLAEAVTEHADWLKAYDIERDHELAYWMYHHDQMCIELEAAEKLACERGQTIKQLERKLANGGN